MVGVCRVYIISYLCMSVSEIGAALPIVTVCYRIPIANPFGTIPSSIAGSGSLQGDTISVYSGNTLLYSYVVGTDSLHQSEAPSLISNSAIDSGVVPFMHHAAYFDYANDTTYWGPLVGTN